MSTIDITTKDGFVSTNVKRELNVDLFKDHLLVLGDPGCGQIIALKMIMDQVLAAGESVLCIDTRGEFLAYTLYSSNSILSSKVAAYELDIKGLTTVNLKHNDYEENNNYFKQLINAPAPKQRFIIIEDVEALFSNERSVVSEWLNMLRTESICLIASSYRPGLVIHKYSELLNDCFQNELNFSSSSLPDTANLHTGEAIVKTAGVLSNKVVRFVPSEEEWPRYNSVPII